MKRLLVLFYLLTLSLSVSAIIPMPYGLEGKWTDGDIIIEISSDKKAKFFENGIVIKEGSFVFEEAYTNSYYLTFTWDLDLKTDYYYSLIVGTETPCELCHEGAGEDGVFTKLPDEVTFEDAKTQDYSGELNSNVFIENPKRYWKDISWVYGEWKIPANHPSGKIYSVRITPFYYQEIIDEVVSKDVGFTEQPKKWYKVKKGYHRALGNVVYIDNLYLDYAAKRIYDVSSVDKKIYLEQTAEYTTAKVKTIFLIIAGIICIGILIGLFFLIRLFVRFIISIVKTFVAWIKTQWSKIKQKATSTIQTVSANTKKQWEENIKPKATSAIKEAEASAKIQWKENVKPKAASVINDVKSMSEENINSQASTSEQNNTSNQNNDIIKKLINICLIILALSWLIGKCAGGNDWVGAYEYPSWKFELRKDGTATVTASDFTYETTWEDGGNWAVVGAMRGEVFLISKNGNLSIRGTNGKTTKLFKLKKTK